ncbi:MAG TPA: DUF2865 domain-containing protein [Xanthobacteraceae bacterium]|nr:DUF2865 domain-containing protein [Xanthobacteraceae bacterium]
MIHLVSGFIKAGLKIRRQTILFAAVAICLPVAAIAQGISASPGLVTPPPRQPISNPGAPNPAPSSNPICPRLESQLTALTQGSADPVRAEQIKRTEDTIAKQQADLDRTVAQAHKAGCAGQGFFALFSAFSPQCGPITSQIQQMRGNLDRMISDLEQLKNGNTGQEGQRRALIGQLAQNNCGAQYTAAANSWGGPQGFFDALFGGGTIVNPGGDGAPSGTYHTVCVRACDGYYFPISYSTVPSRFSDDARSCQRLCPAAEAELYSFHNPGEDMQQAISISGQAYTALPNAFRYRKEIVAGCSCRRPGQSWADALKNADDPSTLESGDIVVTDQNAKALSQPKPSGKPATSTPQAGVGANSATATTASPAATASSTGGDSGKRTVRTVGPPFLSSQSSSQSAPQSH